MDKVKIFSWTAVILWMILIFTFSHQPANASSELSSGITERMVGIMRSFLPETAIDKETLHTAVRKGAHFTVYLILGILTCNALRKSGFRNMVTAFVVCAVYAMSDEVHQLFVSGRSGEIRDVLIDSTGAAAGILFFGFIGKIANFRKTK